MNPGILFPDIHLASFRARSPTKLAMKVWVFLGCYTMLTGK